MRPKDQVDTRAGPLERIRLPVAALVHAIGASGLPLHAHVEQVDEEVVRQLPGPFGEDAMLGLFCICAEHAQAADQNRHLGSRQCQQLRLVHQCLLRRHQVLAAVIVAETVSDRFERGEGLDVGLLLRRVHAPRREGNLHVVPGRLRGLLDRRVSAEHDQVGE